MSVFQGLFLVNGIYLSYNKSRYVIKKREFLQDILNLKALPDNFKGAFDATDCMKLVEIIWVGLIMMIGDTSGLVMRVFACSPLGIFPSKNPSIYFYPNIICAGIVLHLRDAFPWSCGFFNSETSALIIFILNYI